MVNRLIGLKRKAKKEGWARWIETAADEKALLDGFTFDYQKWITFKEFAETFITLSKGQWKGQPFDFMPFQEQICGSLFGWQRPDHTRRFRRGYIAMGKKNSKTTTAAIICLYMLIGDEESAPEVYNVANDRDQAAILWSLAADMVESSPALKQRCRVIRSTKRIIVGLDSWMAAWSSDQSTKDGPNAHCIIADELHEWRGNAGREMWAKIRYAGIARHQPLCPLAITTAGSDRYSLCYEQHKYASAIINGDVDTDLAFYAKIYQADPKLAEEDPDYWKSEAAWKEANPAYEVVLKKEDFESDVAASESDPTEQSRFLRYRLNLWVQSETPWLDAGVWADNKGPGFTEDDLEGKVCFGGLDLSSVGDFTAACYLFPYLVDDVRKFRAIWRIYCPEDTLTERIKKLDIDLMGWIKAGWIRTTPGNVIDHEFVFADIKRDSQKFVIKELGYDRWSAAWIVQQLQTELGHIELFPVNQSMQGMTNATKGVTMALKQGRIEHNGNPVAGWMAGNAVPFYDAKENMMLHKGKSKDKIDGIIAMIIAYAQAEVGNPVVEKKFSVYDDLNFERVMEEIEGHKIGDNQK